MRNCKVFNDHIRWVTYFLTETQHFKVLLFYVCEYTLGFLGPQRLFAVVVRSLSVRVLNLIVNFECPSSVQVVKPFALSTLLQIGA